MQVASKLCLTWCLPHGSIFFSTPPWLVPASLLSLCSYSLFPTISTPFPLPLGYHRFFLSNSLLPTISTPFPLARVPALLLSLHQDSLLSFFPPICILLTSSLVPACLFPSTGTPSYPLSTLLLSCYQHSFSSTTGSSMPSSFPLQTLISSCWFSEPLTTNNFKKCFPSSLLFFFFLFVLKFRLNTSFIATVIRPHLSGLGCCLLKGVFWVANWAAVKTVTMKTEWWQMWSKGNHH